MTHDLVIPIVNFVHQSGDDFRRILQFETVDGNWLDVSNLELNLTIYDKKKNEKVVMEGEDFTVHNLVYQIEAVKEAAAFEGMSCFDCYYYALKDKVNNTTLIRGEFKISE